MERLMSESVQGIVAELDSQFLRKNPSDFYFAKDEKGEVIPKHKNLDCGSLRKGLIGVRDYVSN